MSLTARNFMPVLHEEMTYDLRDIWEILLHSKDSMVGVGDKIHKGTYLGKKNVMARATFQVHQAIAPVSVKCGQSEFKKTFSQKRVMSSVSHYCR
jgi:hypothetical protein